MTTLKSRGSTTKSPTPRSLRGQSRSQVLPPSTRLVEAALAVHLVVVELAFGRDVDDVRVLGVDRDLGDEVALLQADLRPGLAGVGRLPDAVAVGARAGVHRLARAEVEDLRIGRRDGQVAHAHVAVLVEDGLEVRAGVLGLPEAAARGQDVVGRRLTRGHGELGDPAREGDRADPAPAELVEVVGRDLGLEGRSGAQDQAQGEERREKAGQTTGHYFLLLILSGQIATSAFRRRPAGFSSMKGRVYQKTWPKLK